MKGIASGIVFRHCVASFLFFNMFAISSPVGVELKVWLLTRYVAFDKPFSSLASPRCSREVECPVCPTRVLMIPHSQILHWHMEQRWGAPFACKILTFSPGFHSYKRELRAVKAAKEARQTVAGVNTSSSAIPGTNLYNTDR